MADEGSPPPSPSVRRASFAPGQKLSELFGRSGGSNGGSASIAPYPGPIVAAAANAQAHQRRRMSISTIGLSGSPTQPASFGGIRPRQESLSSNSSGSPVGDESAIEEGDAGPNTAPTTPFARRMSFGARALRDARGGAGSFNGRASSNQVSSSAGKGRGLSSSLESSEEASMKASNPSIRRTGEGFNWSDQLRSRAQRSSSIAGPSSPTTAPPQEHQRATSIAAVEPPVKGIPKASKVPDAFQERILKGDFYMD